MMVVLEFPLSSAAAAGPRSYDKDRCLLTALPWSIMRSGCGKIKVVPLEMSVSQHQTNFKMLLIFNKFDQIKIGMERPARAIGRYAL